MATVRPFRTSYDTMVNHWAFWDAVAGAFVEHDGDYVLVAADNTPVERYRTAIKFFNPTAPTWTGTGPIAAAGTALLIMMIQRIEIGGGNIIQIANITDPWDGTETAAEMRALGIDIWRNLTSIQKGYGIPEALFTNTAHNSDNGIMLRSVTARCVRFTMRTSPLLRFLWQYTPTLVTRGDSTKRSAPSAAALAVMEDNAEGYYRQDITALVSERDPSSSDISLTPIQGADPGIILRQMSWPESWGLDFPAAGGFPLSDNTDGSSLDRIRGVAIKSTLSIVFPDATKVGPIAIREEVISTAIQLAGDTSRADTGMDELELRSPGPAILDSQVVDYDPVGAQTVEYDAEHPIYIMIDVILNSGRWLYERLFYNDLVYLLRRYGGVWDQLTFTVANLKETTVDDMMEVVGPLYALAISQSAEGAMAIFNPAEYRPSLKVWTLDEDDSVSLEITDRGRDGQYAGIRVSDTDDPVASRTIYPTEHFPGVAEDWKENLKDITAEGQVFIDFKMALDALGRQLAQRLCGRRLELRGVVGPRFLAADDGDMVKVTAHSLAAETTFMLTSVQGDPGAGTVQIEAIHYPDSLGLASTFEADGILGIWRWYNAVTEAIDLSDMSPNGTDPDWTVLLGAFSNPLKAHWQGTLYSEVTLENVDLLDTTATICDTFDLCMAIQGDLDYTSVITSPINWNDEDYVPIFIWRKGTREGIAVGIYRPGFPGTNSALDNQVFVGHSANLEAANIAWVTIALSEQGVIGREDGGSADLSLVPVSLAVVWLNENIRIYADRDLILSTAGMSKTDLEVLYLHANGPKHNYGEINIGCLRHIRTTGWIREVQRLQGLNGIDPYYP